MPDRRTLPWLFPLRLVATVYTDVFRGVPTILLVYLIGFGVPALQGPDPDIGFILGLPLPTDPIVLGCAALTLSYSAYVVRGLPRRDRLDPLRPDVGRAGARA